MARVTYAHARVRVKGLVCAIVNLVMIVNFAAQATLRGDTQPCPPLVKDFPHNNYVTHQFSLCAEAAAAACNSYVHRTRVSLYIKFEELVLLLQCKTTG